MSDSEPKRFADVIGVALFTFAYLIASTVAAIALGNLEFLFYDLVMVLLIAFVGCVHRNVGLSRPALWALSLWGLMHMAGGLITVPESWPVSSDSRVLYTWWLIPDRLKYDQIVHAYGFGTTTWVCWEALRTIFARRGSSLSPTAGVLLLVACAGMGFGALNEVIEFFATLILPETNVGGYENTGWDLVANLVGALVAVCLIRWHARRGGPDVAQSAR